MVRSSVARLPLLALLTTAFLVVMGAAAFAQTDASAGAAEEQLSALINVERTAGGLAPLTTNVQLTGVARGWTPVMVGAGTISHNDKLGEQVAGSWTRLGENVGVARPGTNETDSAIVARLHRAFMDSPGHRANVLGDFEQIGIGAVWVDRTLWVTVNFMKGGEVRDNAPVDEAVRLSREVFAAAGTTGRQAQYAVVGRAEVFADALGGAGLAGDGAPVLFTNGPSADDPDPSIHTRTLAEIDRVLGGTGTVYLLGGPGAVSPRAERELSAAGYTVNRLAGASRVETSVRVAEEVVRRNGASTRILLARADDWPDAVTGGAYAAATGSPLILTGRESLHPAAAAFLASQSRATTFALGGNAALSEGVVQAAGAQRISGPDRAATAVAVAEQLWGRTAAAPGDRFAMAPGYSTDAWAYALAMAPWSAVNTGPQLLVGNDVPGPVRDYLQGLGYSGAVRGDVFSASSVPQPIRDSVRALVNG